MQPLPIFSKLSHHPCVTLWSIAFQASLSMGFSRQEHWSGCHALLQGIFPIQGSNPHLLHLLHWHPGSLPPASSGKPPKALKWGNSVCEKESVLVQKLCECEVKIFLKLSLRQREVCPILGSLQNLPFCKDLDMFIGQSLPKAPDGWDSWEHRQKARKPEITFINT